MNSEKSACGKHVRKKCAIVKHTIRNKKNTIGKYLVGTSKEEKITMTNSLLKK